MSVHTQNEQYALTSIGLIKLIAVGFLLILGIKLYLAAVLDLYSDEIFYWQASTFPAIAYSDLPFMTALLAGLGSQLDPGNPLATRSLFIFLGSTVPVLIYWIAKPLTDKPSAIVAAGLSLCLPLGGFLGLLAVPDVPLLVYGLISLGCFERAIRTNSIKFWLTTGIFVALGLSTHYRFLLYPLAVLVFLLVTSKGRTLWLLPGLWLSIAISSVGLLPISWFNSTQEFSSISFYFLERHPWEFQPSGLLHVFKQAGLVTPPLYCALLFTAWHLYQRARNGDYQASLFLCIATVNLLVYLILAPWTDATSTSIHWPLSGYFPLLVFLPQALQSLHEWLRSRFSEVNAKRMLLTIPSVGFMGTLTAFLGVGSQAFHYQLLPLVGQDVLSNKMAGWEEFAEHTQGLINSEFANPPIIITDNYYTGAQVEYASISDFVYNADRNKAVRDGRFTQYQIWRKNLDHLPLPPPTANLQALFITEDSTLNVVEKHNVVEELCHHTTAIEWLGQLELFGGDKAFSYYRLAPATPIRLEHPAQPCPYPMRAWIDQPLAGEQVAGNTSITGWAYNEDIGIAEVRVLLDGVLWAIAEYGSYRQDVIEVMRVREEPNKPNVGFEYMLDSSRLSNGDHTLELELVNNVGARIRYGKRQITVTN